MQRKQRSETQMKITLNLIILYTETKIFVVNKSLSQLPFNIDYTTEKNFETVLTNRWQKMTKLENIGVLSTTEFGLHQVNLQMDS